MPAERLPWHGTQWQRVARMRTSGRMPHALLLTGPRGVGKDWFAERLAAGLLCERPREGEPCGACQACRWFDSQAHPDFMMLGPDDGKGPIRVEAIREMIAFAALTRAAGEHKVVVVREAERMNTAAANGLLKTLEEPAEGTVLVLVTAAPSRLPATVRSRCQTIRFPAVSAQDSSQWLRARLGPKAFEAVPPTALRHPLAALAGLRGDLWEKRPAVLEALARAIMGRCSVLEAAAALEGVPLELALEWMIEWVGTLARVGLCGPIGPDDARIHPVLDTLRQAVPVHRLWVLYDDFLELRRTRLTGLNESLVRERLVLDWVSAASGPSTLGSLQMSTSRQRAEHHGTGR